MKSLEIFDNFPIPPTTPKALDIQGLFSYSNFIIELLLNLETITDESEEEIITTF